ncbi:anti-sigma regulatory factor [Quadrisphaera setariae]|uniref:Anti-sigma regulatory factor n=1 Tax=Quadrisphaera setariae TaxID=2593304 RepID=A0A5C8ZJP3_9ACTN|nr:anti-sigma regulatory factor [Quadrisphaera setariae]
MTAPADRPASAPAAASPQAAQVAPTASSGDRVELVVPAAPEYLSVLRTATAGLAARLDLTIDEIEDLRIAVDEACALVLGPQALDGSPDLHAVEPGAAPDASAPVLTAVFELVAPGMKVQVSGPAQTLPGRDSFAWAVLEALVSGLETGRDDAGRHWIRLRHDGPGRG